MKKPTCYLRYLLQVFLQRLFCKRVVLLMVLLYFISCIFEAPIKDFSVMAHYGTSPWVLPFLFSNLYFPVIVMAGVVYFYSNVPFMQNRVIYQIIRLGRVPWGIVQISHVILSAFAYITAIFFITILALIPELRMEMDWGKVFYTLALTNVSDNYVIPFRISYQMIKSYQPLFLTGWILLSGGLLIAAIGNLMFCLSLYVSRLCAISISMVLVFLPIMEENMYYLPKMIWFSPISWLRVDKLINPSQALVMPPLSYPIVVLLISNSILIFLILWKIKHVDFKWNAEDE